MRGIERFIRRNPHLASLLLFNTAIGVSLQGMAVQVKNSVLNSEITPDFIKQTDFTAFLTQYPIVGWFLFSFALSFVFKFVNKVLKTIILFVLVGLGLWLAITYYQVFLDYITIKIAK